MLQSKIETLEAMLATMTGSMGVSELTPEQLNLMLAACHKLAYELLHD